MDGTLASMDSWLGRPCPKCAYVRAATDTNPEWQCPRCQVAYAKYSARTAPVHGLARHGREMAQEAGTDLSLLWLIVANIVAIAVAVQTGMGLADMMLVYWIQSVIIGIATVIRILRLRHFSTEGFKVGGGPLPETTSSKVRVALFFTLHYGMFHLGYLAFIAFGVKGHIDLHGGYWLCALAFAANHAFSLRHNLARDAAGRRNLSTLMILPYARVVPMHFAILTGSFGAASAGAFFLFVAFKTLADAVMHVVEHHVLASPNRTS